VRAGCIAFSALCALSLHRGFVLELLTFLKCSPRELFRSGAVGFVTGQVLLLCEASSAYARVFVRGVSRRHEYSQRRVTANEGVGWLCKDQGQYVEQ
jgi:hypothetical protein